jgi:hypothetical protein
MSDLYTSQVHLKRLLAGRATPAFTRASEDVLKVLDPAFMLGNDGGLGGLNENATGLIQCPVRGCGEWFADPAAHMNKEHRGIGGAKGIRAALDLPSKTPLYSRKKRPRRSPRSASPRAGIPVGVRRKAAPRKKTIMSRNMADTCPAQLQERLAVLARNLGRSPSRSDFEQAFGATTLGAVRRVFGSWTNAKAILGLPTAAPGQRMATNLVVESLRTWVEVHGDLPSSYDARKPEKCPIIPKYHAILGAFGVDSWSAAMQSAVQHLGISSERYGTSKRRVA